MRTSWQVGEQLASWFRPQYDSRVYPYCPAHITRAKEVRKIFIVPLPDRGFFAVAESVKLLAVPLFELYDNAMRYGPIIAAIPVMLSRFSIAVQEPQKVRMSASHGARCALCPSRFQQAS